MCLHGAMVTATDKIIMMMMPTKPLITHSLPPHWLAVLVIDVPWP